MATSNLSKQPNVTPRILQPSFLCARPRRPLMYKYRLFSPFSLVILYGPELGDNELKYHGRKVYQT